MSTPTSNHVVRAGAVAAFLATAVLGWNLAGDRKPAALVATAPSGTTAKKSVRTERGNGRYGTPAYVRDAMKSIRNAGSTEGRMRATIELANTLPVADIAAWLDGRWFDTGDGFDLTLFNKIVKQRWREEDPESLLLWSFKNGGETSREIMGDWAANDPQRLIEFYRKNPNDAMELQSLSEVAKKDPALAISRLQEMIARGIPANASGYDQYLLTNLAAKSPAALEAALGSLPASWQIKAEMALIGERLNTSFDEEIRKLWERPDGWKLFENCAYREGVGEKLFGELANLPASWRASMAWNYHRFLNGSNAQEWIGADLEGSGFTDEQAKRIRMGALQNLTYQKPELTLNLLGDMEMTDDERRSVISNVFANAARNPEKAEELLAMLDSDEDRKMAQSAIDQRNQNGGTAAAKVEEPADWLAQAGEIDLRSGASYSYMSMLENWDKDKIADLTGQFRSMPDEEKRKVATLLSGNYGGGGLDPALQAEAIRYLVATPAEQAEDGQPGHRTQEGHLASVHAVKWAAKDPVAASEWVQTLPAGDAKLWAQKNLAKNWAQYDPDAAGQWVASLPAAARTEVEGFMKK